MKPVFVVTLGREILGIGCDDSDFRVWLIVEIQFLRVYLYFPFVFTLHTRYGFNGLFACLGVDFLSGTLSIAGHGGNRLIASLGDKTTIAVFVGTGNGSLTIFIYQNETGRRMPTLMYAVSDFAESNAIAVGRPFVSFSGGTFCQPVDDVSCHVVGALGSVFLDDAYPIGVFLIYFAIKDFTNLFLCINTAYANHPLVEIIHGG